MTEYCPLIIMLGEQIAELKGKMMGQRVLDAEGPTMETSISARGTMKGAQVNENLTYVARPVSAGVLHGKGQGVVMAGESDMAAYTGEGLGRLSPSGVKWRGAIYYGTLSTGRLAFLNNVGEYLNPKWTWRGILLTRFGNGSESGISSIYLTNLACYLV